MKFLTNHFKKGQLTKLFFLFAVSLRRGPLGRAGQRPASCCRTLAAAGPLPSGERWLQRFRAARACRTAPLPHSAPATHSFLHVVTRPGRTLTSRLPTTGGASSSARCWPSTPTCWRQAACCTPSLTWRTWATGRWVLRGRRVGGGWPEGSGCSSVGSRRWCACKPHGPRRLLNAPPPACLCPSRLQRDRLEAHPLFERVSEEELENDAAAQLLLQGTEEGQKVARNGGKTWRHVYRRIAGPSDAAAGQSGAAAAAAGAQQQQHAAAGSAQ